MLKKRGRVDIFISEDLIAECTQAGLAAARASGRLRGRPRKMYRATIMMADPKASAVEVARRLDITTTTLCDYVNGDGALKETGQVHFECNMTGWVAGGKKNFRIYPSYPLP